MPVPSLIIVRWDKKYVKVSCHEVSTKFSKGSGKTNYTEFLFILPFYRQKKFLSEKLNKRGNHICLPAHLILNCSKVPKTHC